MKTLTKPTTTELNFLDLKAAVQLKFNEMVKRGPIFRAMIDNDKIWEIYLKSFPEGTNPMFRERTEHDCNCCRAFIRRAGSMVQIVDGKLDSIWDLKVEGPYQLVANALAEYVKSLGIENVYLYQEPLVGTDQNRDTIDGHSITWHHFCLRLPASLVCRGEEIGPKTSDYQAMHDVVLRSLKEITDDAIEVVQDLISQNSLYRGSEKKNLVDTFADMKKQFTTAIGKGQDEDLFAWNEVIGRRSWVCKIRNDVVGTLLVDLSEGMDLEKAVKLFEDKVSGSNYQRPTALVTPRMRDQAKEKIEELGLMPSLDRQYAKLEHISINNVLFADRSIKNKLSDSIFDEISVRTQTPKNLDKLEEIHIDKFISDILPKAQVIEVLVENQHINNLVSLIAPYDFTAKSLFKWDNPFSWSYNGDVADSIKQRVKTAGGNVTGDVCCRLAWSNSDDLDLHMSEDLGRQKNHIFYGDKRSGVTGGCLDVDMNASAISPNPVENIYYADKKLMKPGTYTLYVSQFRKRDSNNGGFEVEIDILGETQTFSYPQSIANGNNVEVAKLQVDHLKNITLTPTLASTQSSKEFWNIKTLEFIPVTAVMLSPNFWNDQSIGNKHFFFMLANCKNDGSARGFYNEFLNSELEPHRKVMELVGSKIRTEEGSDQMSGLGFSSTKRASLIVKVQGSFTRMLKINF